jgi:NADH-quinone oxidoreductase subunit M
MVNHGLSTGALFLLAGFLIRRRGTQDMTQMCPGLQRTVPLLAGTFLVVGLSAVALPGLSTFVSEFQVMVGTFQTNRAAAIVASLGVILAALYILLAYQKIFTGPVRTDLEPTSDLRARELWVVGPLIALMLVFGFYPKPAIDLFKAPVAAVLQTVADSDQSGQVVVVEEEMAVVEGGQP